jgi:hypothetical protein
MTSPARRITLVGPDVGPRDRRRPLWTATLSLSHAGEGSRPVPDRTVGLRVLLQDGTTTVLPRRDPIPEIPFLEPQLVELLVGAAGIAKYSVEILGSRAVIDAVASSDGADAAMFRAVAVPRPDGVWPYSVGHKPEIRIPPLRLAEGRVRVRISPNAGLLRRVATGRGVLFGHLPVGLDSRSRLALDLLPDGVEFTADPANPLLGFAPFVTDADAALTGTRLKLRILPDDRLALDLVGFEETGAPAKRAARARKAFAALVESVEGRLSGRGSPLRLRANPLLPVPPLRWIVTQSPSGPVLTTPNAVEIDATTMKPGLEVPGPDGGVPEAATFEPGTIELIRTAGATSLSLRAGQVPAGKPSLGLTWTPGEPTGRLVATLESGTEGKPITLAVDSAPLAERLGALYRAANVLPPEVGAAPFAFLPIQRGVLQVALPARRGESTGPGRPDVLVGNLTLGLGREPRRALTVRSLEALAVLCEWRGPDPTGATEGRRDLKRIVVRGGNPAGSLTGYLWVFDSSPSPEEVVPTLRTGPVALRDLTLEFGDEAPSGIQFALRRWASDEALELELTGIRNPPATAWVSLGFPAVAAIDMTRTVASALLPSLSRGLVPLRPIDEKAPKLTWGDSAFPTFHAEWPLWDGVTGGWPWAERPNAAADPADWPAAPSVDLVVPTLPDVVLSPRPGATRSLDLLDVALRFDLAFLDGYFAGVSLPDTGRLEGGTAPGLERPITSLEPRRLSEFWRQAAERLALTRTESAFATRWIPAEKPTGELTRVTGLAQPLVWRARFGFRTTARLAGGGVQDDAPLGSYALVAGDPPSLDKHFRSGAETVGGLRGTLEMTDPAGTTQTVKVTGFAVAARLGKAQVSSAEVEVDVSTDSRSGKIAANPWTRILDLGDARLGLRWASSPSGEVHLGTLGAALPVRRPGAAGEPFHLAFTDLPLRAAGDRLEFQGVPTGGVSDPRDPLESAIGPTGDAFGTSALTSAPMRWRFFDEPAKPGAPRPFDLAFGPFRFRPLRLCRVSIAPAAGGMATDRARVEELDVLGRLQFERRTVDGPFGADGGDQAGNLVLLRLAPGADGTLEAYRLVRVQRDTSRPFLALAPSSEPLRFTISPPGAGPERTAIVEIGVDPTGDLSGALENAFARVAVRFPGMGLDAPVPAAATFADGVLTVTRVSPDPTGDGLFLMESRLRASERPYLSLAFVLRARSETGMSIPLEVRFAERYGGSEEDPPADPVTVRWLGGHFWEAGESQSGIAVDLARGTLSLALDLGGSRTPLIRGLVDSGQGLSVRLHSLAALGPPSVRTDVSWPVTAALIDLSAMNEKAGFGLRHRIDASTEGGLVAWSGRIDVTWTIAQRSLISWPQGIDATNPPAAVDAGSDTVAVGGVTGLSRDVSIQSGDAWTHRFTVHLNRHELPADRLAGTLGDVHLGEPWRVLAVVEHGFGAPGAESRTETVWRTLDDVTLFDARALAVRSKEVEAALDELQPGRVARRPAVYAFAGRYMSLPARPRPVNSPEMIRPGIGESGTVMAGFPVRAISRTLAGLADRDVAALVISGAGLTRVSVSGPRHPSMPWTETSLFLALPWIGTVGAEEISELVEALTFTQSGDGRTWKVADADLVSGIPVSTARLGGVLTLTGSATEAGIHDRLAEALAEPGRRDGWRRPPLAPVEQAFFSDGGDTRTTPFWIRSIQALSVVRELASNAGGLRAVGLVPAANGSGAVATVELARRHAPPLPAPGNAHLAVLTATEVVPVPLAMPADAVEQPFALARALDIVARPLAVAIVPAEDDGRQPGGTSWSLVPVPATDDFGAPPQPLRCFEDLVHPSGALDWPSGEAVGTLAGLAAHVGEEEILQSDEVALAGNVRVHGFPPRAFAEGAPVYLGFAEKPVFRRPILDVVVAPAAFHALPAPARQRAPTYAEVRSLLRALVHPIGREPDISHVLPLVPPNMTHLTLGRRPGVVYQVRNGAIVPIDDQPFDPERDRFGRPAASGPTVVRQGRSPRSTALPEIASPRRRRRTIVAWDDQEGGRMVPFRWLNGSAGVIRRGEIAEVGILVRVAYPRDGLLGEGWNGSLILAFSSRTQGAAQELAGRKPIATLVVGTAVAILTLETSGGTGTEERLAYKADAAGYAAIVTAIKTADGDTRASVALRYPDGPKPTAGDLPPLYLSLDLPLGLTPAGRPSVAVGLATLVFSDPSYDRMLSSATASDGRPTDNGESWMLAADRQAYDRDAVVVFAYGAIDAATGALRRDPGATYPVRFNRIPAGPTTRSMPDPIPILIRPDPRVEGEVRSGQPGQVYAVSLRTFLENDARCIFQPGDLLEIVAGVPGAERAVQVRITAERTIPPAPSVFALVRVADGVGDVPLFASAPLPQSISFPAIERDLASGLVRRRAHFQWVHPQDQVPASRARATLVKVDRTGGAQLPALPSDLRPLE